MQIKQELINELARRSDIDLIGVVDLNLFNEMKNTLSQLDSVPMAFFKGKLSDRFDYLRLWSETKGIISFALSYNTSLNLNCFDKTHLCISKASFGKDYHRVLKEKAENFMQEFCKIFPCKYKVYVDTGILSDRALAYCAGIGFYGKNNFIINEKYGSFIFLGHILTDIEFDLTVKPPKSQCKECEKCIKMCPQGAYENNKPLNFEKCISYLTQKAKPYSKTNYIYGCDICQNVCPFNKNAPCDLHEEFSAVLEDVYIDTEVAEDMSEETFYEKYSECALCWRGIKTFKKNVKTVKSRS